MKEGKVAKSPFGMVSTASPYATNAGALMLEMGGNAVDAAVAAAFCLGVTEPQASGLGGQSMALLHIGEKEKKTIAVDGSSRAPYFISLGDFNKKPLKNGIKATTVPSTPAVLGYLLDKYGTLPFEEVLKPAIKTARKGYELSKLQNMLLARENKNITDEYARSFFYKKNEPRQWGSTVFQDDLANILESMANEGWKDFYTGKIGVKLIDDMENRQGLIKKEDLMKIPIPLERKPLKGSYCGFFLETFPPPGAGRALFQILNTLENFGPGNLEVNSKDYYQVMALAFHAALMNREHFPVDPERFHQVDDKWMIQKKNGIYTADRIKEALGLNVYDEIKMPKTSGETTHLSVADKHGNAVGITQSIEKVYGAKTMAANLGFFYNNYMSAFNVKDVMHPYYLLPGAKPYSSVAPTLVKDKAGKAQMIIGSPGSERISTVLSQILSGVLAYGKDIEDVIAWPRIHAGSGKRAYMESEIITKELIGLFDQLGFEIIDKGDKSFYMGCVQAVLMPKEPEGLFMGAADPRRDGTCKGPEKLRASKAERKIKR